MLLDLLLSVRGTAIENPIFEMGYPECGLCDFLQSSQAKDAIKLQNRPRLFPLIIFKICYSFITLLFYAI